MDLNESIDRETAYKILAYLCEHRDAGDTIGGISEWWLMEQRIKNELVTVENALEMLEENGLVIKSRTGVYRINAAKIGEIQALLREASS